MSPRLMQLLLAILVTVIGGFFVYPLFYPLPKAAAPAPVAKVEAPPPAPVVEDGTEELNDEDFAFDDTPLPADDDTADDGVNGELRADSYMPANSGLAEEIFREDNVPVDEAQNRYTPENNATHRNSIKNQAEKLAKTFEKQQPKPGEVGFVRQSFPAEAWKKPEDIYRTLVERIMPKLGDLNAPAPIWAFLEDPANQLDLATHRLIYLTGEEALRGVASAGKGAEMLAELTSDLEWMRGLLFSGPARRMDKAMANLSLLYTRYTADMKDPVARRIATTAALEFAREGWGQREMEDRFVYFYSSYKQGKLNRLFNDLRYWETRFVTGAMEPGQSGWGSVRSMTWQRDNVRLPVEGYVGAAYQLQYRLKNIAGDSVFSSEYLAPILKYTNNTTAWAHRCIGGVCGALSHYGTYGAIAAGLPAITMGEPGHCAYTVRVGNQWQKANSIYWQHGLHKTFWKEHTWDFLILTQKLYEDYYKTLASDHLVAVGDLLSARRKTLAASRVYEDAVTAQPLNWPAWLRSMGYLRLKAADESAKWTEVHDKLVEQLAPEFHDVSATMLAKYIYPNLFRLVKDRKVHNKLFDAFFAQCKDFGHNRWNIAPLLNAQMAGCSTPEEKFDYMKDALKTLMGNPAYAGSVLSWGLDAIAAMQGDDDMKEKFTDLIITALSRARTTRKEMDATWAALGEAITAASDNKDRNTFQAIGKLAGRKCKKKFPKNKFRIRPIPGKIVSQTALLTTKTELSGGPAQQACLHWGVLQKHGGSMPCKFGGQGDHLYMELEQSADINGVACIFSSKIDNTRDYVVDVSADGSHWVTVARARPEGAMLRIDCRAQNKTARFLRLWRDGDKYEPTIIAFYVYGKPARN